MLMEFWRWMKWPDMAPDGNSAIEATPSITYPKLPPFDFTSSPSSANKKIK